MNPYAVIGTSMGRTEAVSLGIRLSAWHDAMVAHERQAGKDECDDECPHAEAGTLWVEALETFGPRAYELTFLHSRGNKAHRGRRRGTSAERRPTAVDPATSSDEEARL